MKRAVVFMCFVAMLLAATSLALAEEYRMTGNSLVPAATGVVSTDVDRNGNTKIHVDVSHLAPPSALSPARNAYVVWVQPRGQAPQNQGELKVNNELNGSFRTAVPFQVFEVFVTAENNPRADAPEGPQILKATVEHR